MRLTLNDHATRNSLSEAMMGALETSLRAAHINNDIAVIKRNGQNMLDGAACEELDAFINKRQPIWPQSS